MVSDLTAAADSAPDPSQAAVLDPNPWTGPLLQLSPPSFEYSNHPDFAPLSASGLRGWRIRRCPFRVSTRLRDGLCRLAADSRRFGLYQLESRRRELRRFAGT
jgi:hypothetical protein